MEQNKKTIRHHTSLQKNGAFYAMLLPFVVIFTVFTLIPALVGVLASFTNFNGMTMPGFTGLDNYFRLFFKDQTFLVVFRNTLWQAMLVGPLGYILSFAVAWLINELGKKTRLLIIFLFYSPSISGTLFVIWKYVFANDSNGVLNGILARMGVEPINWLSDQAYSMIVVIIVSLWMSFGAGFLSFVAGFHGLDRAFYEAAAIDGLRNRWQELYYVTLPQMGPQLLFGAVQSIASSFAVGSINLQLTGYPSTNNATDTILLYMNEYGKTRFELGYASAMSVFLMVIMLILWKLINSVLRTFNE